MCLQPVPLSQSSSMTAKANRSPSVRTSVYCQRYQEQRSGLVVHGLVCPANTVHRSLEFIPVEAHALITCQKPASQALAASVISPTRCFFRTYASRSVVRRFETDMRQWTHRSTVKPAAPRVVCLLDLKHRTTHSSTDARIVPLVAQMARDASRSALSCNGLEAAQLPQRRVDCWSTVGMRPPLLALYSTVRSGSPVLEYHSCNICGRCITKPSTGQRG